jgi:hypothetical protein
MKTGVVSDPERSGVNDWRVARQKPGGQARKQGIGHRGHRARGEISVQESKVQSWKIQREHTAGMS